MKTSWLIGQIMNAGGFTIGLLMLNNLLVWFVGLVCDVSIEFFLGVLDIFVICTYMIAVCTYLIFLFVFCFFWNMRNITPGLFCSADH